MMFLTFMTFVIMIVCVFGLVISASEGEFGLASGFLLGVPCFLFLFLTTLDMSDKALLEKMQTNYKNKNFEQQIVMVDGVYTDKLAYKEKDKEEIIYIDKDYSTIDKIENVKIGDIVQVNMLYDGVRKRYIIINYQIVKESGK